MAYKNKKEYKKDKRYWSGPMRDRSPAGYDDFKRREAAWLQQEASKDRDDDKKKKSSSKSSGQADRSSGKYEDIKQAQQEDRDKGNKTAESFKNKQAKTGGISPELQAQLDSLTLANSKLSKQLAISSKSYEEKLMQMGLQQQQSVAAWEKQQQQKAAAYQNQLAKAQAGYQKQLQQMQSSNKAAMQELQAKNQTALQQMQAMMLSQQQAAANTQQLLQSQLSTAQSALTEQKRVSSNLANAYVPEAEETADTIVYGDSRQQERKQKNNQLSDLSIVSGVGTAGSLAGLQLAG